MRPRSASCVTILAIELGKPRTLRMKRTSSKHRRNGMGEARTAANGHKRVAELRRSGAHLIDRLSASRLRVAVDFLSYLAERESNPATDELLRIPGFTVAL